ncbi:holin [Xanthomonas phage XAJ2]|uniref:Holin n=1 Tax=Xanthomonas phage XAJ2 TaxID=1775249 RepID=A0A1I9L2K3_9CAUD|nr:holin [Xanthomonas phage XAJ2]
MNYDMWSILATPPLSVIFITAIFGLNDVGLHPFQKLIRGNGIFEMLLGVSFLVMAWGSFMMLSAVLFGASIYTWRGCTLMWGIGGALFFAGKFAPWRIWIRRLANLERLERRWKGEPDMHEIAGLIADGRKAVAIAHKDKGGEAVRVLPKIVVALEQVAAKQYRINMLRADLKETLDRFKTSIDKDDSETDSLLETLKSILDRVEGALKNA